MRKMITKAMPLELAIELGKERLLAKVKVISTGCWEWQGFRMPSGYGCCNWRGSNWSTHRLAYTLWKGPIPDGLDICHSCDNKPCCNPDHLWLGDQTANSLDVVIKGRHYLASRTHCPRGHELSGDNVKYYAKNRNWRACAACDRAIKRIAAGWPEDLAYSLPKQKLGYRPISIAGNIKKREPKGRKSDRTLCKRGHPLSGDNLYVTPDGRRQCRTCHRMHVTASAERTLSS